MQLEKKQPEEDGGKEKEAEKRKERRHKNKRTDEDPARSSKRKKGKRLGDSIRRTPMIIEKASSPSYSLCYFFLLFCFFSYLLVDILVPRRSFFLPSFSRFLSLSLLLSLCVCM